MTIRIAPASAQLRVRRVHLPPAAAAFTLIELILVMTILTIAISIMAPALGNFFRGRSLDAEMRQLLALSHLAQSRAVSEGVPVEVWLDGPNGTYGLEAEPSYEPEDPKAVDLTLDKDIQLEVLSGANNAGAAPSQADLTPLRSGSGSASSPAVLSKHANLPRLRFLPDGTCSESSPQTVRLTGRDGNALYLVQSRNRLTYEIRYRIN